MPEARYFCPIFPFGKYSDLTFLTLVSPILPPPKPPPKIPGYASLPACLTSITRTLIEDWHVGSDAYPGSIFIVSGRRSRNERLLRKRAVGCPTCGSLY